VEWLPVAEEDLFDVVAPRRVQIVLVLHDKRDAAHALLRRIRTLDH